MKISSPLRSLLLLISLTLFIAACVPVSSSDQPQASTKTNQEIVTPLAAPTELPTITLPITVYILDDAAGEQSSTRTAEQLNSIYDRVNDIWGQANIEIKVESIHRLEVPASYLTMINNREFERFFNGIGQEFSLPEPSLLNGFYAAGIGGPNGITPYGTRVFFVTDFPSVHHERVTSHEIGHILGLHHVITDSGRLMFSGTNGTDLSAEEITTARYAAQGLLDGVR